VIDGIQERGFDFSIRIAELVQFLRTDKLDFPLCERLLSCGVETGLVSRALIQGDVNCEEDTSEREINRKRALTLIMEADYIIEMAQVAGYLTKEQCVHIRTDCKTLLELLRDSAKVVTGRD